MVLHMLFKCSVVQMIDAIHTFFLYFDSGRCRTSSRRAYLAPRQTTSPTPSHSRARGPNCACETAGRASSRLRLFFATVASVVNFFANHAYRRFVNRPSPAACRAVSNLGARSNQSGVGSRSAACERPRSCVQHVRCCHDGVRGRAATCAVVSSFNR